MKSLIKKIIGEKNLQRILVTVAPIKDIKVKKISTDLSYEVFGMKGKNVFFGYYDLQQFSNDSKLILVHSTKKNANPKYDSAEIGMFSLENKNYIRLVETKAWSWQQGARLRWHPIDENCIIYNDFVEERYVSQVFNIKKNQIIRTYDRAFYDIDRYYNYGLSLNFDWLQKMRPGYGYSRNPHIDENDLNIYYTDLNNGNSFPIITRNKLGIDEKDEGLYYLNHISIAPDSKHFIFFCIQKKPTDDKWTVRLYVSNQDGSEVSILEDNYRASHYTWKDSSNLLVTCYDGDTQFYMLINILSKKKTIIFHDSLNKDGHPSYMRDKSLITDTYPHDGIESLIKATRNDMNNEEAKIIARFYHAPCLTAETRCDLHPRLSPNQSMICIDTTFSEQVRKCVILKI